MIPLDVRLTNFIGTVAFAADEDMQRAVFMEKKVGLTSIVSVGELFCQFFDDNDMDGFIRDELASAPIRPEQKASIVDFAAALNAIEKLQSYKDDDDRETIASKEWAALVRCAKQTLSRFSIEA